MICSLIKRLYKDSSIFNFNVINRNRWISAQANNVLSGSKVLDAGAGSCPYSSYFSHCKYYAQDSSKLRYEQLSGDGYGKLDYVCDITAIPVDDGSFDVILCSEVLEHLPYPINAINEFHRILKHGGLLILTAPLGSGIHQEPYHFYGGYTPYWYQRILPDAGFSNISIEENSGSARACAQEALRFIIYPEKVYEIEDCNHWWDVSDEDEIPDCQ